MNSTRTPLRDRLSIAWMPLVITLLCSLSLLTSVASAQVRTKKPDRGVYQPPLLSDVTTDSGGQRGNRSGARHQAPINELVATWPRARRELVEVALEDAPATVNEVLPPAEPPRRPASPHQHPHDSNAVRQASHTQFGPVAPAVPGPPMPPPDTTWTESPVLWEEGSVIHDATCDGCSSCDGCDSMGCDSMGCDSVGCDSVGCDSVGCDSVGCDSVGCDSVGCGIGSSHRRWFNSSLSCDPCRWFGSVELMLMWRKGDRPPPLVTTGNPTRIEGSFPNLMTVSNHDRAGQLGQADTQVVVGGTKILKDMTAGGRFMLGTWLDDQHCRSLVLRGWAAGEENYSFAVDQSQIPVLARPFLNVSDNQDPEQDTLLIAFPEVTVSDPENEGEFITIPARADGSVSVKASSEVFGGDFSVRQFIYGRFGGRIEALYGYQYMRLNESLGIASSSISLDNDVAPVGSVLAVADSFKARNEFHGAQVGFATHYRERCWSFHSLCKVGFGSLRREAKLAGSTLTSIDGDNTHIPNGLLVRSTNAGTTTDHTFGWIPELDLSLGWHQNRRCEVTVGYHIIAMTDALQASGTIDPNLAVNLSDPPMDLQRPALVQRYSTYYVQGIHFGLQHIY